MDLGDGGGVQKEGFDRRLFTVGEARAAGISPGVLRSNRFQSVLHSVHVRADVPITPRLRAEAALLLVPDGVLSHHTAMELWGAAGPSSGQVHLSVHRNPKRALPRIREVRIHEVQDLEQMPWDGLTLTSPVRTFIDLAACTDLADLVAAGDSLVRRTGTRPELFRNAAAAKTGARGIRRAREAAELIRLGVDSPMESRLRLLLVLAGLPEPQVGRIVYFSDGGWLAQPDLSYPEQKIAIEYDGRHHLEDVRQWRRDIARRENLEREGWLVRVITAGDLLRSPAVVIGRILEDLHTRGHPGAPAAPDLSYLDRFAA